MSDICLVRQPTFGSSGALLGYEIRFRESAEGGYGFAQSFVSGTFDAVRNKLPAFVPCTRLQLIEGTFMVAERGTAVLLLDRDLVVDQEVLEAVGRYREAGGGLRTG